MNIGKVEERKPEKIDNKSTKKSIELKEEISGRIMEYDDAISFDEILAQEEREYESIRK